MGYRHYIGVLDKEKHEVIKDMTIEQLQKWHGDEYVACYEISKELHELGKYFDDEFLKPYASPVFSKTATNKYYKQDNDFFLLSKEGLEAIIDAYRNRVKDHYEDLIKQYDLELVTGATPSIENFLKERARTWGENCTKYKLLPYELKGEPITTAWEYEYAIFELVRIYKTINWDKQLATVMAW